MIPPFWPCATYGLDRIWLCMCPEMNSKIRKSETAAQTLRLFMMGSTYGHATVAAVKTPTINVVNMAKLIQLNGRRSSGFGASGGNCREIQPCKASADGVPIVKS